MKSILKICCLLPFFLSAVVFAQNGTVKGKVKDEFNKTVEGAKIEILNTTVPNSTSNQAGEYSVSLPSGEVYRIRFTHPAHDTTVLEIRVKIAFIHNEPITMLSRNMEDQVIEGSGKITDFSDREQMEILPIRPEDATKVPLVTSIEKLIGLVTGGTGDEFSSQYRVRGGNFSENLVYVNGIEIYRPFLVRSGQQEGLGFTNPNLAEEVYFSTGGFAARYGDKLSSVLDVTYREPEHFKGTAEVGLLTTNLHIEGVIKKDSKEEMQSENSLSKPGTFTYLMGGRRFATTYLLNSLETQGQYKPNFLDYQGMFTYTPKSKYRAAKYRTRKNGKVDTVYFPLEKIKFSTFFAVSRNNYVFQPEARETTFGTIQQAFRLRVAFEGREKSSYTTGLGALVITHRPTARLKFDYTLTGFRTEEQEVFDVEGGYLLGEVNTNFGSDEFGESEFDLGIGTQFRHARNYLTANVLAGELRGEWTADNSRKHKLYFGGKYVFQQINDDIKEYEGLDSAGYFINNNGRFGLIEYIKGSTELKSNTIKAYLQHRWQMGKTTTLHTGVRALHYDITKETLVSPRVQFIYDISKRTGGANVRLRLASGLYYQPPFYREFRRLDGTINTDIKSQRSIHFIGGLDYQFVAWNRDFRFFSEIYYKKMSNLIPYEVQNVRIRYYPDEVADGYAYGIDARLHGQFIKGVDSWISLNVLKTQEDVLGDTIGYIPRPTDQRFSFSMFFQDELPINPTYKVHVNYIYGSGVRHGPPTVFDRRTSFDFPAYHRVDLGFSKIFAFNASNTVKRGVESVWATVEIFNLFQRANTVSHTWIKDLQNRQFAIPNNLSARLLNVRLVVKFR